MNKQVANKTLFTFYNAQIPYWTPNFIAQKLFWCSRYFCCLHFETKVNFFSIVIFVIVEMWFCWQNYTNPNINQFTICIKSYVMLLVNSSFQKLYFCLKPSAKRFYLVFLVLICTSHTLNKILWINGYFALIKERFNKYVLKFDCFLKLL